MALTRDTRGRNFQAPTPATGVASTEDNESGGAGYDPSGDAVYSPFVAPSPGSGIASPGPRPEGGTPGDYGSFVAPSPGSGIASPTPGNTPDPPDLPPGGAAREPHFGADGVNDDGTW